MCDVSENFLIVEIVVPSSLRALNGGMDDAHAAKVIKQVKNATNDIKREILDNAEDNALTEVKKTVEEGRDAFKEVTRYYPKVNSTTGTGE